MLATCRLAPGPHAGSVEGVGASGCLSAAGSSPLSTCLGDLAAENSSPSTSAWVSRLSLMSSAALNLESPPFCGRGRAPVRVGESIERGGLDQGLGRSLGLPGSPGPDRSRQSPARSPAKSASAQLLKPALPPAARQQSHSSSQRWPGEVRGITGRGQSQPIATMNTWPARALPKPEASACGLKNGAARG